MRFVLTDEQRLFGDTLHDLLTDAAVPAIRAWAAADFGPGLALWRTAADAGVTALAVPEDHGGVGVLPVELAVAFGELGHHAAPGPYVETVAAAALLSRLDVGERWLSGLASGDLVATVRPPGSRYAPDARAADVTFVVDGTALHALTAAEEAQPSIDPARWPSPVSPDEHTVVTRGPEVAEAWSAACEVGTLACAARSLGLGRALLETTTGYAKQREQFGHPIGEYQAVKHHLADALVGLEFARPLLYAAALALADGSPDAARDVSAAKVTASEAAYAAARTALQVHGAIGYTDEYDPSLWIRKVRALVNAWGTPARHRARIAAALA